MSLMVLAGSALSLGFLHGLGADHLMAIAALTTGEREGRSRSRVMQTAVGFAVGHTMVLAIGGAAAVLFGVVLPAAISSGAERAGGAVLVALGALGLWTIVSGRAYAHIHPESDGRMRWHARPDALRGSTSIVPL